MTHDRDLTGDGSEPTGTSDNFGATENGEPQPKAMEVESARQLEMAAAPVLSADGFARERIRELADAYIALDVGTDTGAFIAWARKRTG